MRVLLDTNVILDSMLSRPPWDVEADAILQVAAQGGLVCAATPLSLATAFYVGRRSVGTEQARLGVSAFIRAFEILALDQQTMEVADALGNGDFEDNIQIAAAVQASVDAIVTRNPRDFTRSTVTVLSPTDLLRQLQEIRKSHPGEM